MLRRSGLAFVGMTAVGLLVCHCGKSIQGGEDAGTTAPVEPSGSDAGGTGSVDAAPDASPELPDAAPDISCTEDASVCDGLPASRCADDKTVLYFSDGTCTDGKCVWKQNLMPCQIQSSCVQGGCTPPTTM